MKKLQPIAKLDVNNIFFQLDQIARQNADASNIQVVNLGVDQQKGTFVGPGQMLIVACAKNESDIGDDEDKFKKDCFNALKTYVKFFASEAVSGKLKENSLEPIRKTVKKDTKKDKTTDKDKTSKTKESIDWSKPLVHILVEEDIKDTNSLPQIVGYSIPYKMELEGQKDVDLKNTAAKYGKEIGGFVGNVISGFFNGTVQIGKDLLKTMFGGVASDIASIRFHTFGNHSVGVKDVIDPTMKISKSIADVFKTKIVPFLKNTFLSKDIDEIVDKLQKRLNEKYPGTTAKVNKEKKNVLIAQLKKEGKLEDDVKKILDNPKLDYCITVDVDPSDKNYPMYSVEAIAKHLAYVVSGTIFKQTKIDNEKEKAEVFNFLSKNYAIAKVSGYSSNVEIRSTESLDLMNYIDLIFEADEKLDIIKQLVEVSSEFDDIYNKIQKTLLDDDGNVSKDKIENFAAALLKARDDKELTRKELYPDKDDKRGVSNFVDKLKSVKDKKMLGAAFAEIDGKETLNKLLAIAQRANPKKTNLDVQKTKGTTNDLYIIAKPKAWNQASSSKDSKQETTDKEKK